MPTYAFGSKRQLYEAVMQRAMAQPRSLAREVAAALEGGDPVSALRRGIESYIDFLSQHPTYVRLLERAALDADSGLERAQASLEGLADALGAVTELLGVAGLRADPRQFLVSMIALCFFPLAHNHTVLRPLGLDISDPTFLAQRKVHVVELLLNALSAERAEVAGPASRRRSGEELVGPDDRGADSA